MRSYLLVVVLTAGCLEPELVTCSDGRSCPAGTLCDEAHATCIDPQGISMPEGDITFTNVGCDASATLAIPLRNYGLSPITFEARSLLDGVTATPASGTIEPGAKLDLMVTATPGVQTTPEEEAVGSLVVTTTAALTKRTIRMSTFGAVAKLPQSTIDFGETGLGQPIVRQLVVENTGNAPLQFSIDPSALGGAFKMNSSLPGGTLEVAAHSSRMLSLEFQPVVNKLYTSTVPLTFSGTLCQPPPASVELVGVASGDPLLADHTVLDFGSAACGAAAASLPVTLTSNLDTAQTLSSVIEGESPTAYAVIADGSIGAGPGATQVIDVTRVATPAVRSVGVVKAELAIDALEAMASKRITLQHTIVAPVLVADAADLDLGKVGVGGIRSKVINVRNDGNAVATVSVSPASVTKVGGTQLIVQPNPFQIGAGQTVEVTFQLVGGTKPLAISKEPFTFTSAGQCSPPPIVNVSGSVDTSPGTIEPDPTQL